MAKAQLRQREGYTVLDEADYNLVIDYAESGIGPVAPYAHIVFRELKTSKRIDGTFTLGTEESDAGVFAIVELFDAINGCSTNQSVDLAEHDFDNEDDNLRLMGSVVTGHVWIDMFQGRERNKVGRIRAAVPVEVPQQLVPAA